MEIQKHAHANALYMLKDSNVEHSSGLLYALRWDLLAVFRAWQDRVWAAFKFTAISSGVWRFRSVFKISI